MPNWVKMIEAKIALAKRGAKPSRAGNNPRIPPGQKEVHDFPVLDLGLEPEVSPSSWNLRVFGLVEEELEYTWKTFNELPQVDLTTDFHCVTRWSQLDMNWRGVPARSKRRNARSPPLHAIHISGCAHGGHRKVCNPTYCSVGKGVGRPATSSSYQAHASQAGWIDTR